jgi:hypothetical protein
MIVSGSSELMIESAKMPRSSRAVLMDGLLKATAFVQVVFDQVRNYFGVSFCDKLMILLAEAIFELR